MYLLCSGMYIIRCLLPFSCTYFARECTSSVAFSAFHVLTLLGNVHHPRTSRLFMYLLCSRMYIIRCLLRFSCTYFARECTSSGAFSAFHVLTLLENVHHPVPSPLFMYLLCSRMYIIRCLLRFSCTYFAWECTSSDDFSPFSCTYFARECTSSGGVSPFHVLTLLENVLHPLPDPLLM